MGTMTLTLPKIQQTKGRDLVSDYLSVAETAKRLRVSRSTIVRWISVGFFPNARQKNPRLDTSPYEIPIEDVIAFEQMDKKS